MLKLTDLEKYDPITIQCHDNPDGDALGSGFGLYFYFKSVGKNVRFIYGGRNEISKANLKLMVEKMNIPVEYVAGTIKVDGLLITVDSQYGAGNITRMEADTVAIIDHHEVEINDQPLSRIEPELGSCSTLVWMMLKEAGFEITDINLGTALYYGLFTDTKQLTEIFNPNDMDMRDEIIHDGDLIRHLMLTNLSLPEMEIAGLALLRTIYNADYQYAMVKVKPCDPNLLGLIADFLIQVAEINSCVVYNEQEDGYKLSVRSSTKEVRADELAAYLTEGIGNGGGHKDKAGGFIRRRLYEEKYTTLHTQAFVGNRLTEYFDNNKIIYARTFEPDPEKMPMDSYRQRKTTLGYVDPADFFPVGSKVTIRSVDGDLNAVIDGESYIVIGLKGKVSLRGKEDFRRMNRMSQDKFLLKGGIKYQPTMKNNGDGRVAVLLPYAKKCESLVDSDILAHQLTTTVRLFPAWDEENYQLGKPGDYLCVRKDDPHGIFILERDLFEQVYERS